MKFKTKEVISVFGIIFLIITVIILSVLKAYTITLLFVFILYVFLTIDINGLKKEFNIINEERNKLKCQKKK